MLPCKAGRTAPTLEAGPDLTKADLNPPDVAKLRFRVARKARTGAARLGDRHPWWALGVFAICLVCIHGLVVLGEPENTTV